MSNRGRKTKLTPDIISRITDGLRLGMTKEHAAMRGGISETSFYEYLTRAKNSTQPNIYTEFAKAIKKAESDCLDSLLAQVTVASRKHWQAAAWLLERRYPAQYGRTINTSISSTSREEQNKIAKHRLELKAIIDGKFSE